MKLMNNIYVTWIGLVLIVFFLVRKAIFMYRAQSNGNSVKTESDMFLSMYLELIIGLGLIFLIWVTEKIGDPGLNVILFYCVGVILAVSIIALFVSVIKHFVEYIEYKRTGQFWVMTMILLVENAVWIYLFLAYYNLRVQGRIGWL